MKKAKGVFKKSWLRVAPLILIVLGVCVAIAASIILWRQKPTAPPRRIISRVVHQPYIVAATAGLILGGIVMAFFQLSKETQRRSVKAFLTILAAFLVFGGPTYLIYVLRSLVVPYSLVVLVGLVSLITGLVLFVRLIKGKE